MLLIKRNVRLTTLWLLLCLAGIYAGAQAQPSVQVCRFWGGRQAALSLTFDDGLQDQFTLLRPELNRRGLRATFAVIGSKVGGVMHSSQDKAMGIDGTPCMTWEQIQTLKADGHEIGSHGWEHKNVTKLTPGQLRHEVQANDSAVYAHVGVWPQSYFYPGNQKTAATVAFCEQDRIGSRTFQTSIGSKRDSLWLRQWVNGLLGQREWGVGMTHGIQTGYDHFSDPQVLWDFLDYVASRQDSLWVTPFAEVAAYVRERDHAEVTVRKAENALVVSVDCSLSSHIFSYPLTLAVGDYDVADAVQDGHPLALTRRGGKTLIDINPHGGDIFIFRFRR